MKSKFLLRNKLMKSIKFKIEKKWFFFLFLGTCNFSCKLEKHMKTRDQNPTL